MMRSGDAYRRGYVYVFDRQAASIHDAGIETVWVRFALAGNAERWVPRWAAVVEASCRGALRHVAADPELQAAVLAIHKLASRDEWRCDTVRDFLAGGDDA